MAGSVYDLARKVSKRSGHAVSDADRARVGDGSRERPRSIGGRAKPKPTSMAPNAKNKRNSYGRPIGPTAAEERSRKKT